MAYDEGLAERVRVVLATEPAIDERKMFGGLAFMARGNMCCGIIGGSLLVRVAREDYETMLARPHVREMDFTGRPMRGFVLVDPPGIAADEDLAGWVDLSLRFVATLPPK